MSNERLHFQFVAEKVVSLSVSRTINAARATFYESRWVARSTVHARPAISGMENPPVTRTSR